MNIENQEVSVKCGNSECYLYDMKIMIDMDQYKAMRWVDGIKCIIYYELPHFYCAGCFRELSFTMKEKKWIMNIY